MALRYALLGALADQPRTGYALLKHFEQSLAYAWPASHSQIYPELARLLDDGLIEQTGSGARNSKTYAVTDAVSRRCAAGCARASRIAACAATQRCGRSSSGCSSRPRRRSSSSDERAYWQGVLDEFLPDPGRADGAQQEGADVPDRARGRHRRSRGEARVARRDHRRDPLAPVGAAAGLATQRSASHAATAHASSRARGGRTRAARSRARSRARRGPDARSRSRRSTPRRPSAARRPEGRRRSSPRPRREASSRPSRARRPRGVTERRGGRRAARRTALAFARARPRARALADASPAKYASVAAFHARQHAAAATGSSSPSALVSTSTVPLPSSVGSGRGLGAGGPSARPPPRRGTASDARLEPWRARPSTAERRAERRLVDEADGRSRAAELDSAGDGRRRGDRRRPRARVQPAAARRAASASSRSSCHAPSSGSRGGSQSPIAARTDSANSASSVGTSNLTRAPRARPRCRAPSDGAAAAARALVRRPE